jgi:ankyrin repeat protein
MRVCELLTAALLLALAAPALPALSADAADCPVLTGAQAKSWLQFLAGGLRLHDPDATRTIPLVEDIFYANEGDLRAKLNAGLDPDIPLRLDSVGDPMSLLSLAVATCKVELAQLLLRRGANVNGIAPSDTPLVIAAAKNQAGVIDTLLAQGARLDKPGPMGKQALETAVRQHHSRAVAALLEYRPEVNRDIGSGATVLSIVENSKDPEDVKIAQLLRAHGATAAHH